MNYPFLWFTKITGLLPQFFFFRKKIYCVNKEKQDRKIKGKALIISNHKSIYDFPLVMFTFFKRNIRVLIGEVLFQKNKLLSWFLKRIGGIKVERHSFDFSFMDKSMEVLNKNKVLLIYPESRLPTKEEKDLLEFKTSYIYLALKSGAPIIPIYTNGKYGKDKKGDRARIIIGEKIYVRELYDNNKSDKDNINYINNYVRNIILDLQDNLKKQIEGNK